jgi:hypothetical protein
MQAASGPCATGVPETKHASHRFFVTGNEELLKRSMHIAQVSAVNGRVNIDLETPGVGHSFPTGDLFRSITVHVRVVNAEGRVLINDRQILRREYTGQGGTSGKGPMREVGDSRILNKGTVSFPYLPSAKPASAHVTITYRRGLGYNDPYVVDQVVLSESDFAL